MTLAAIIAFLESNALLEEDLFALGKALIDAIVRARNSTRVGLVAEAAETAADVAEDLKYPPGKP